MPQELNQNPNLKCPRRTAVDVSRATATLYLYKCSATTQDTVDVKTVPLMVLHCGCRGVACQVVVDV